ncbi:MAG: hypothetical protein AB8B91_21430 [Rubripirellula sp.]
MEDAYRNFHLGGYSVSMFAQASQALFSSGTLLWLVGSFIVFSLLFGAINRRRTKLTESLREFVDQTQTANGTKKDPDQPPADES